MMQAPIAETYSVEMRELILSTLHLDPAHRPSLFQVSFHPRVFRVPNMLSPGTE